MRQFARAKINLTLHVGRVIRDAERFHGYHPLNSLVAFADVGDRLDFTSGPRLRLAIEGPFADALDTDERNLVVRAARAAERLGADTRLAIRLTKALPVASGLGGGSADAAAVLRALLPDLRPGHPRLMETALGLGADVPACVHSRTLRMTGIGETLSPLPGLGRVSAVLANPGVAVSTAEIFRRFDAHDPPDTPRPQVPVKASGGTLLERALAGRNDLEPVARALEPRIGELADAMATQPGCELARMSGSGASVFGLFSGAEPARAAARVLRAGGVWAVAAHLGEAGEGGDAGAEGRAG